MDELFNQLEGNENAAKQRASYIDPSVSIENRKILQEAEHVAEAFANLEDELDELEAQMEVDVKPEIRGTMDIEKPVQKPIQRPIPVASVPNISNAGFDSFIRTLYSRQKERDKEKAFTLHKLGQDEVEEKRYELDLVENKAQLYLIDVQEDFQNKSRLLVFGKVKVKDHPPVSCCLAVLGMERRYYFFKKENENVV